MPSTCPIRLRMVVPLRVGAAGIAEPGLPPARGRRGPGRSAVSTRLAWATVAGSSAQICSTRSPPDHLSSSRSTSNTGSSRADRGPGSRRSDPVEQLDSQADGDRQPGWAGGEFGFGVGQRRSAAGQAGGVGRPQSQDRGDGFPFRAACVGLLRLRSDRMPRTARATAARWRSRPGAVRGTALHQHRNRFARWRNGPRRTDSAPRRRPARQRPR